jgi:hypothetical protein
MRNAMTPELNRRDFLQTSLATGAATLGVFVGIVYRTL